MCVTATLTSLSWIERNCLVLLSFAALQTCEPQRPSTPRPSLASVVINAVLTHARSVETHVDPKQPLLVDAQSFVNASRSATDASITEDDVENALSGRWRDVNRAAAVRCRNTNCGIQNDALFIQLDSMSRTSTGLEAVATYIWTDRRPSGNSGIGWTRIKIWLHQSGDDWVVQRTRIEELT